MATSSAELQNKNRRGYGLVTALPGKRTGASMAEFADAFGMGTPDIANVAGLYREGAGAFDPAQANETRGRQTALASMLEEQARGEGPSVAQDQLRRGQESAMAQQIAMSRSQTGQGAGLAQRQASMNQAGIAAQGASDSAMLRNQEQMAARSALGNVLGGIRQQDTSAAQFGAEQRQRSEEFKHSALERQQERELGQYKEQQAGKRGFWGGLAEGAGKLISSMSDERMKEDVGSADDAVDRLLAGLNAKSYKYKNPEEDGEGRRVGVMAQDLEKSDAGSQVVEDTPRGKMVDHEKALPLLLAAAARLNDRVASLEGKPKAKGK